jgi:hypothetical protein
MTIIDSNGWMSVLVVVAAVLFGYRILASAHSRQADHIQPLSSSSASASYRASKANGKKTKKIPANGHTNRHVNGHANGHADGRGMGAAANGDASKRRVLSSAHAQGNSSTLLTRGDSAASSFYDTYFKYVNPRWVDFMKITGFNVEYIKCLGTECFTVDGL